MNIDYINGTDRVLDGQARFNIVNNPDNTISLNLANEIISTGTRINKALHDKIDENFRRIQNKTNMISKYNTITGEVVGTNINFELDDDNISLTDIENNQRLLIEANNIPVSKDYANPIITENSTDKAMHRIADIIRIDENHYIIAGEDSGNKLNLKYIDGSGIITKESSSLSNIYKNLTPVKLNNGNIMYCGNDTTSSTPGYFTIIDSSDTTIVSRTAIGNYLDCTINFNNKRADLLSNGNVVVIGHRTSSTQNGNFAIIAQDGTIVKAVTGITTNYTPIDVIGLNNGNFIIIGRNSNNIVSFYVFANDGTLVQSQTQLTLGTQFYSFKDVNGDCLLMYIDSGKINIARISATDYSVTYIETINESSTLNNCKIKKINDTDYAVVSVEYESLSTSGVEISCGIFKNDGTILKQTQVIGTAGGGYTQSRYDQFSFATFENNIFVFNTARDSSSYSLYLTVVDYNLQSVKVTTKINYNELVDMYATGLDNIVFLNGRTYDTENNKQIALSFMSAIESNSISNIPIDTILVKDKYYELLYKESENKFLCEEVRV